MFVFLFLFLKSKERDWCLILGNFFKFRAPTSNLSLFFFKVILLPIYNKHIFLVF